MPAALALLARQIIIVVVQMAAYAIVEKAVMAVIDKIRAHHIEVNGLDPDDADTETANNFIDLAIMAGVTLVMLRTKLPVKAAQKLGFTSKGWVKRPLSAKGQATLKTKGVKPLSTTATTTEKVTAITETVVKSKGSAFSSVSKIANVVVAVIGVPVGVGLLVVNTIDFAAWPSSSYQNAFQKFFSFFGLNPDTEAKSSKVLSEDMWNKVYNTYVQLGATGINNPFTNQSQTFSRDTLIALVDKIAAGIIAEKGKVTLKEIIGATQGFLVMGAPVTDNKINTVFGTATSAITATSTSVTVSPITKVFTGIVSQGVVGQGLVFEARPDDMIESAEELRQAAANNLAPYLNTLLGKIVYEVKVVSNIITKEGFKQSGTTQKIISGYDSKGNAKYKTVTNKFATLVVYALTDKGSRAKLTTIVLGPTDSAKLTIGTEDLRTLETELPNLVTTTDINDIKEINTNTTQDSTATSAITATSTTTATNDWWIQFEAQGKMYKVGPFTNPGAANIAAIDIDKQYNKAKISHGPFNIKKENPNFEIWNGITASGQVSSVPVSGTTAEVSGGSSNTPKVGQNATTLSEWYQAQGQSLPSIAARSLIYAGFDLGQSSYYTGTAEQNTKLLSALKAQ
jgi:hypothetical protein